MMTLEDVTADSTGTDVVDRQGHVSWLALGLGVRAGVSPSRLVTLFLRPSASFTTSRPTFAIDGFGPLYKVPFAAVGVEMGSEWIF
jgi:carbohydrate-selective porin OprB